jgi:glycosyltransferase involved in cell wall biosynthesis
LRLPGRIKEILWGWKLPWYKHYLNGCEMLFAPSFFEVNMGLNIPQVTSIHDLSACLFPDQRGKSLSRFLCQRAKLACEKAQKIIAISKSTKNDLVRLYKIPSGKITVTYLAGKSFKKVANQLPDGLKKDSYILATGTIEPRKNLSRLFQAYAKLDEKTTAQYPLVIAGAKGWNTGLIYQTIKRLNLKDKVIFLGYISDESLARVYQDCLFFVYPSLYEGFGIPLLEAFSFGKTVLTSDVSSMPEVSGDAALLVDPNNVDDIARGLEKLISDDTLRLKLQALSQKRAKDFSWVKTASQTLQVLESVKLNA